MALDARIIAAMRRRAWDSRTVQISPEVAAVPTMLTEEETKMLLWIGQHCFSGKGAVVELGSFLGGSTVRLASGLARSGHPWSIDAYDRFEISEELKKKFLYSRGQTPFDGTDMLHVFRQHLARFEGTINPHKGDVEDFPWDGREIEILFVDLSKSTDTNSYIIDTFFPRLIPGQSVVIQQDYQFFRNPWLAFTMEKLHPKLEMVAWTREYSTVYVCHELPTQAELDAAKFDSATRSDVEATMERAIERFPYEFQREMVRAALDAFRAKPKATKSYEYPPPSWTSQRLID